jgi:hypothetical protein
LAESSGGEPPEFSIDELRSRGGPFYSAIADALTEEVAAKHAVGAADAFNRLPDSMRRSADIMAVLDYAAPVRHPHGCARRAVRRCRHRWDS